MKKLILLFLALFSIACNKGEQSAGKSSISGTVFKPMPQTYVYVYKEGMDLKGPAFTDVITDSSGNYSVQLPPGKYFLVARMRKTGEVAGPVEVGDIKSEVIGPVTVTDKGEVIKTDIKVFEKKGESKDIAINVSAEEKKTTISGYIFDADGKPVQNARVHVYDHVQMSERPKFVSSPTGPDGKYSIALPKGGTYYLAARDKFGGPPKVGDLYGRYDKGTIEPSGVVIKDNERLENINITVHRVW